MAKSKLDIKQLRSTHHCNTQSTEESLKEVEYMGHPWHNLALSLHEAKPHLTYPQLTKELENMTGLVINFRTVARYIQKVKADKHYKDIPDYETASPVEETDWEYYQPQLITMDELATRLLNRLKKNKIDLKQNIIQDLAINYEELDELVQILKDQGYNINAPNRRSLELVKYVIPRQEEEEEEVTIDFKCDKQVFKFGVVSDTHLGSKHQQLTHLNNIYDLFEAEGITTVFHPGDLTEGENMRREQKYETFIHGQDEYEEYVIENYPKRKNMKTYFILGN